MSTYEDVHDARDFRALAEGFKGTIAAIVFAAVVSGVVFFMKPDGVLPYKSGQGVLASLAVWSFCCIYVGHTLVHPRLLIRAGATALVTIVVCLVTTAIFFRDSAPYGLPTIGVIAMAIVTLRRAYQAADDAWNDVEISSLSEQDTEDGSWFDDPLIWGAGVPIAILGFATLLWWVGGTSFQNPGDWIREMKPAFPFAAGMGVLYFIDHALRNRKRFAPFSIVTNTVAGFALGWLLGDLLHEPFMGLPSAHPELDNRAFVWSVIPAIVIGGGWFIYESRKQLRRLTGRSLDLFTRAHPSPDRFFPRIALIFLRVIIVATAGWFGGVAIENRDQPLKQPEPVVHPSPPQHVPTITGKKGRSK